MSETTAEQTTGTEQAPSVPVEIDEKKAKKLASLAKARAAKAEKLAAKKLEQKEKLDEALAPAKPTKGKGKKAAAAAPAPTDSDRSSEEDGEAVIFYEPPKKDASKKEQKLAEKKMVQEVHQMLLKDRARKQGRLEGKLKQKAKVSAVPKAPKASKDTPLSDYHKSKINGHSSIFDGI